MFRKISRRFNGSRLKTDFIEINCRDLYMQPAENERHRKLRRSIINACAEGAIIRLTGAQSSLSVGDFATKNPIPSGICKIAPIGPREIGERRLDRPKLQFICREGRPELSDKTIDDFCTSFDGDWEKFHAFIDNCQIITDELRHLAQQICADFDYEKDWPIWRMSLAQHHKAIHFDPGPCASVSESVRLFMNIDDAPRIWRYSDTIFEAMTLNPRAIRDIHHMNDREKFAALSQTLSKIVRNRPTQEVAFSPGDIWICDGRAVSHQVLEGRKAIGLTVRLGLIGPAGHKPLGRRLARIEKALTA